MGVVISRFDVYLVNLDPTIGHEARKTRPCLIVSPDEMNRYIGTVIIAPMTIKGRDYPTRVNLTFQGERDKLFSTKSGPLIKFA
jgi:mRNA interferase MazF